MKKKQKAAVKKKSSHPAKPKPKTKSVKAGKPGAARKAAPPKKAAKAKAEAPGKESDAPSDNGDGADDAGPVNLTAWARGEGEWPWQEVSNAIGKRFNRRVPNKQAAIEFLVDEKIVALADLAPDFQKLVKELV